MGRDPADVARKSSRGVRLAPPALRVLLRHDWPLDIRELEKTLVTALALAREPTIELSHLPAEVRRPPAPSSSPAVPALAAEDAELRAKIIALLTTHRANVVAVARELGARRTQIYRWAHRFQIDIAAYRE